MVKLLASAFVATLAAIAAATPVLPRENTNSTPTAGSGVSPTDSASIKALQTALLLSAGFSDRQNVLLPNPPDATNITFQFINNTVNAPTGGTIALTTLNNFPALIGTNVGMAIGFVNPCGLNVPHNHPRANEFLTVISGTLIGGLILEVNPGGAGDVVGQPKPVNGPLPQVNATLENFKGMLFPQGETHFQFNPTCKPALFAAAFDSSDPGRTQIARNFFSAYPDEEVLIAAVGGNLETLDPARIEQFREQIPTAFAVQIESCVKRCGIPHAKV
ncbi:RmlC-like cupin [Lentithecium fluviatile CBS 122367]|uniref:RmlC-like cupin n=1 Tax=Lentithecium fluviatile CBS 122367 TaxID=1168545 RepID=A0A6G1J6B6_9PLEO|nr:RmlC-like cupin [Lentithecium fluviatile CBS 122367]